MDITGASGKVKKIFKMIDSITSPLVKIQIMGGKFGWGGKGKTKNSNVYDSLKVMRSNPDCLLKSSLL